MATSSVVDYLAEKLYSLSSKMWGSSLQPSSTSFLMNENTNFQQCDLSSLLAEVRLKDRNDYQMQVHPSNKFLPFHRFATGILGFRQLNGLGKFNNLSYMAEKEIFPYLFNFVPDFPQTKHGFYDSSLVSFDSKFLSSVSDSANSESHIVNNQMTETMKKEGDCKTQVIAMSFNVSHSAPKKNSVAMKKNSDVSPTMRLNIELAHRKTKEISKRSKKRRRRKKRSEHLNITSSTSASDDDTNNECNKPVTDNVCFLSKSPDLQCSLSVSHTVQFSPCNFLISVTSDSEDDSDWEKFDETEISAVNNLDSSKTDSSGSPSSNSSPMKSKTLKSSSFKPVNCSVVSSIISFVVPEADSNDEDDSDWDKCETDSFHESTDFELNSGLYFTNLCTPQNYLKNEPNSHPASIEDNDERLKQRAFILEANIKWNELDDGQKFKPSSKVTFAPDEDLIEVFPVEIYDRKGEWETYVTARDRFKRKVNELEKIISPCLRPEHRSKIFKKFVEPQL